MTADQVVSGVYFNKLYNEFDSDLYPNAYPPPIEP